jgi:hypothetical protein
MANFSIVHVYRKADTTMREIQLEMNEEVVLRAGQSSLMGLLDQTLNEDVIHMGSTTIGVGLAELEEVFDNFDKIFGGESNSARTQTDQGGGLDEGDRMELS